MRTETKIRLAWGTCAGALFLLYLYSAYPAISPYRDSGDMAASALTLGVAHPPGYPLYLLLARAWIALMPLGNIALRLHILSALAGAGAALLLAWAVRRGTPEESPWPAAAGAAAASLLLGLAPGFWHLALVSEMYTINALVGAALLFLLLPEPGSSPAKGPVDAAAAGMRRAYLAALLFGLGLGNHQTLVAVLPGLLWIAHGDLAPRGLLKDSGFWTKRLPPLALFALAGFALYVYLPVRSAGDPVLDWGEPESWRNFLRMLTRADYGGVRLHPDRPMGITDVGQWGASALFSGRLMVREIGWTGVLLGMWGIWAGRRRPAVRGSLAAFLISGPLFILWANLDPARPETYPILQPHLVLPLVFAAALAGWGAADLFARARCKLLSLSENRGKRLSFPLMLAPHILLALLMAAGWLATMTPRVSRMLGYRTDYSAWDYGKGLLACLPKDSLVLDPDDPTAFTLSYMSLAHGLRRDVRPLLYFRTRWGYEQLKRRHPELLPDWEISTGQELLGVLVSRNLKAGRALYLDLPQKAPFGHTSFPLGLAYRLRKDAPSLDERLRLFHRSERMHALLRIRPARPGADFFTQHTVDYWSSALNNLGIHAQALRWPAPAVVLYRRALTRSPLLSEAWNNLANTLLGTGDAAGAEGCYRLALRAKPTPQVRYNLGRVLLLSNRFAEAEREFRRSIRGGGPPDARNDLGLVYLRTGKTRRAVDVWMALLRERPEYLLAYFNLAEAHEKLGEPEKAFAALSVFAELTPNPAEKAQALRWMRRLKK